MRHEYPLNFSTATGLMKTVDAPLNSTRFHGLPTTEPKTVGMFKDRLDRIGAAMQRFIDTGQAPGLLTVVARHGKVVYANTQGYANVAQKKPVRWDTIFRIKSMTKPITGVAVMMLFEEGHFFLDDPISNYLPEFGSMQVWTEAGLVDAELPITIRHLLTHTAGLTYSSFPNPVAKHYQDISLNGVLNRLSGDTLEQHIKKLAGMPLLAQPGTAWTYGEAMGVLGRLVEVVSGCSFRTFLKQRIFDPLGMVDTDFFVPPEKKERLATLYDQTPRSTITEANPDHYGGDYCQKPTLEYGGAGLVGTSVDYLRFAQMLLNQGELDGHRLLSPVSVKLMMSNHLGSEFNGRLGLPLNNIKGLGFGFTGRVVTDAIAAGSCGSNGEFSWGGWANTDFWIDPKQDLIGIVLTQVIPNVTPLATRSRMHQMTYQTIL